MCCNVLCCVVCASCVPRFGLGAALTYDAVRVFADRVMVDVVLGPARGTRIVLGMCVDLPLLLLRTLLGSYRVLCRSCACVQHCGWFDSHCS